MLKMFDKNLTLITLSAQFKYLRCFAKDDGEND